MKKKTPFLDFYKRYGKDGIMPSPGLCLSMHEPLIDLFDPGWPPDRDRMGYLWGYDGKRRLFSRADYRVEYEFTPLRQTIVLFCAVISGEY